MKENERFKEKIGRKTEKKEEKWRNEQNIKKKVKSMELKLKLMKMKIVISKTDKKKI